MERVLVLGGSFSAVPLIKKLKKSEYFVVVCGSDKKEPGHLLADRSLWIDYSEKELLKKMIPELGINFIVPSSNDVAYATAVYLADLFGFPGYDSIKNSEIFLNKSIFRETCKGLEIPVPEFRKCEVDFLKNYNIDLEYPILIKPVNSHSGIGIVRIENKKEFDITADKYIELGKFQEVVLETFIEGSLHSYSTFIQNGTLVSEFFVDEFCKINQFAVDSSNHPSKLSDSVRKTVRGLIQKLIDELKLCDGLLHTQFIHGKHGTFIVESMRRNPGDLYSTLIEISTNFDYVESYLSSFLSKPPNHTKTASSPRFIARFTLALSKSSFAIGYHSNSQSLASWFVPLIRSGEKLESFPSSKIGILFLEFRNFSGLTKSIENDSERIILE
jgi:formate-dependent phosphoribosylglycinamide formyltransferase (GAR transformylase)